MKITGLFIENFLRVEAAEIRPDGNMVVVAGPNGAGKSTLINAIWAALGGSDAAPEMPVRKGEIRAQITVELGDGDGPALIVERVYTASGSRLRVTERREDGAAVTFSKPQEMLSAMLSGLAFDPEAFARMKPRDQADLLAKVTGLDTSDLDAERDRVYAERRDVNRDLRNRATHTMPGGERPERVDAAELSDRIESARQDVTKLEQIRSVLHRAAADRVREQGHVADLERRIERLQEDMTEAKRRLTFAEGQMKQAEADIKEAGDPDAALSGLLVEMRTAQETNNLAEQWDREVDRANAREALEAESEALTARLDEIDAALAKLVAECPMPVDGLAIEDGAVLHDGVPFSQLSSAQRLDISLAIGMAQHPKLKVLRIENGSLLDRSMMAVIEKRCAERGYQAWIERVADEDSGVGIYIEDGIVAPRDSTGDLFDGGGNAN